MKKIGLIGIGKMGLSHLAIARKTPGIEVVAICDVSAPLMYFLGKNTKIETFKNYKKMVSKCALDGVMICVPNSMHYEVAKHCIEEGVHVFIEKPLTLSSKDSKELCEFAFKNNIKGQVGYVNRFNPVFRRVKELIDTGVIGEVVSYLNKMTGGVILKANSKGWRNDYSKGGGCLFDYGPHCFDLSCFFFGSDIRVEAASLTSIFSTKVDDIVSATFKHSEKIVGFNYINWSDSSVRKASNSIEIIGTKGKILANKQEISIYCDEALKDKNLLQGWNQLYVTDENTDVPYYLRGEDFSNQLIEFSALINGKIERSISSLEDGSVTDRLLEDILKLSGGLIQNG